MKCVLIDVDGVIVSFAEHYFDCAQKILNREFDKSKLYVTWDVGDALNLSQEERIRIHECFNKPGTASNLPIIEGSVEGVKRIAEIADVYFVTAPYDPSPTWVFDRNQFLQNTFGKDLGRKVINTYYKERVAGNVLIDDKLSNIDKWTISMEYLNIPNMGIVYAYNFNKCDDYLRTNNWDDIFLKVKN